MNNGLILLLGLFLTMCYSWYGFIYKNFMELGHQAPALLETGPQAGLIYPGRSGAALQGQDVYRANGCVACHTMQVRHASLGPDIKRGWGKRQTVMQDFAYDKQVFLGSVRIGPDLADVGSRRATDWQFKHLYSPKLMAPGSTMPPFRYLFETRRIRGARSAEALNLTGVDAPPADYEVVPSREAKALVAYLQSLRAEISIFEAPLPLPKTNAAPASLDTNAPTTSSVVPATLPQK